jgi:hypothetical protein
VPSREVRFVRVIASPVPRTRGARHTASELNLELLASQRTCRPARRGRIALPRRLGERRVSSAVVLCSNLGGTSGLAVSHAGSLPSQRFTHSKSGLSFGIQQFFRQLLALSKDFSSHILVVREIGNDDKHGDGKERTRLE